MRLYHGLTPCTGVVEAHNYAPLRRFYPMSNGFTNMYGGCFLYFWDTPKPCRKSQTGCS